MKSMKFLSILSAVVLLQFFFAAKPSSAHHTGEHAVVLHTNTEWSECAIVLDPSLTQTEFNAFIGEMAELMYFHPLAGAKPLGRFNFEIALDARGAQIEDWQPKWNNTFSHPHHDHTLVGDDHILSIPGLRGRMGVTDSTDIELYFTTNPNSNYGFFGAAVKYAIVNEAASKWAAAVRGSYMTLLGVDDMDLNQLGVDFIVSRDLWLFTPYAGGSVAFSYGVETTGKVDLSDEDVLSPMAFIGTQFVWKYLSVGLEQSLGRLPVTSFKIGAIF